MLFMRKKFLLSGFMFINGCTLTLPISGIDTPNHPSTIASAPVAAPALETKVKHPRHAMINFIGNVTMKKANELTSYIHKEMNNGVKNFTININSNGGETDAGISVYQYLKALPISVTTHNIGTAQSAATIIYCSGSQRYALEHSFFMLHGNATTYNGGMSLVTIEGLLKLNKMRQHSFTEIFKHCANLSTQQSEQYFSSAQARYFSATEAKDIGLVNTIAAPPLLNPTLIYNITD